MIEKSRRAFSPKLRIPWRPALQWASWGPTMWRYFRKWSIARITMAFPIDERGSHEYPKLIHPCRLCSASYVNLYHLLSECTGTRVLREGLHGDDGSDYCAWSLCGHHDVEELYQRVRYFGIATSMMEGSIDSLVSSSV